MILAPHDSFEQLLHDAGVLEGSQVPPHLRLYVEQAQSACDELRDRLEGDEHPADAVADLQNLLLQIAVRVMSHPVTAGNCYLARFAEGVTAAQARHECQQFSIFALQFDVAQAKLVANAPTLDAYKERLRLLLNEKGFPYHGDHSQLNAAWDPNAVHFAWLCDMAEGLGLGYEEVGKTWLAQPGTDAFVNVTFEQFAHIDPSVACGAAFAIENWAASGLWKKLLAGMEKLNAGRPAAEQIDLRYLQYHDHEEGYHSQAMLSELLGDFTQPWFNPDRFLKGAMRVLNDGVLAYYESQLATLPDRDDSWPAAATEPQSLWNAHVPAVRGTTPTA